MEASRLCGGAMSNRVTCRPVAAPKFVARPSSCTVAPHSASLGPSSERLRLLASAVKEVSAHGCKKPSIRGNTAVMSSPSKPMKPASATWDFLHSRAAGGALLVTGCVLLMLLEPQTAHCEELSGSALDVFQSFLEQIRAMGPTGVVLFIASVMITEMVPLFPTQPLSLASGLLFGPLQGAVVVLTGMFLAATNAFFLSRGVGRSLAQKIIAFEMSPEHHDADKSTGEPAGPSQNGVGQKILELRNTIEQGNFVQQLTAVFLLRLTPIIPFSASNYIMGLTPIGYAPFALGTLAGMSGWSLLYASLGGASRVLLDSGMDMGMLIQDLLEKASGYSAAAGKVALVMAGGSALAYAVVGSFKKEAEALQPPPGVQPHHLGHSHGAHSHGHSNGHSSTNGHSNGHSNSYSNGNGAAHAHQNGHPHPQAAQGAEMPVSASASASGQPQQLEANGSSVAREVTYVSTRQS